MRNHGLVGSLLAMLTMAGTAGCHFGIGTGEGDHSPHIGEARTALDHDGRNPTSTFRTTDSPIYCVVPVTNAVSGTKLGVAWWVVDAGGGRFRNQRILTGERVLNAGETGISARLIPSAPLPPGTYKVDLMINDQFDRTLPFTVR